MFTDFAVRNRIRHPAASQIDQQSTFAKGIQALYEEVVMDTCRSLFACPLLEKGVIDADVAERDVRYDHIVCTHFVLRYGLETVRCHLYLRMDGREDNCRNRVLFISSHVCVRLFSPCFGKMVQDVYEASGTRRRFQHSGRSFSQGFRQSRSQVIDETFRSIKRSQYRITDGRAVTVKLLFVLAEPLQGQPQFLYSRQHFDFLL